MEFTIEDAKNVVNAWESLPEGHYDSETIQEWLISDMQPAINKLREKIKQHEQNT